MSSPRPNPTLSATLQTYCLKVSFDTRPTTISNSGTIVPLYQNSNILSFSRPWLTDVSLTFTFLPSLNSDSEKDNQQQRQNTIHSGQILESEGNNQHVKRSRNEITGPGSRWFAIETFFVKFTCMLPKFTSCIKSIYKVAWQIQISKYNFEFKRFRRFSFYKIRKNIMSNTKDDRLQE